MRIANCLKQLIVFNNKTYTKKLTLSLVAMTFYKKFHFI